MGWEEIGHNLFQDTIFAFAGGRKTGENPQPRQTSNCLVLSHYIYQQCEDNDCLYTIMKIKLQQILIFQNYS